MREEARGFYWPARASAPSTPDRRAIWRVYEHREGLLPGVTRKYGVKKLVWFEPHVAITDAYRREQLLKRWRRAWKIALIEANNPYWEDLYPGISGSAPPSVRVSLPLLPGRLPGLVPGSDPGPSDEAS